MKILIVEDHALIGGRMKTYLKQQSYQVQHSETGTDALIQLHQHQFDVLVLDLGLPDFSGLEVMKTAQSLIANIKVIVVSAQTHALEVAEVIRAGADDYMRKPFSFPELESRIEAVSRRGATKVKHQKREHKGFVFDPSEAKLSYQNKEVLLTNIEQKMLKLLFEHKPEIVPYQSFLERIWGSLSQNCGTDKLHVNMNYLRKKVRQLNQQPLIETCRYLGYRLA